MNDKSTIDFLQSKIKQLELDVQYEMYQKEQAIKRCEELELILKLETEELEKIKKENAQS
jgi:hypothetical protein